MKHSVIVISPLEGGLECEPVGVLAFEMAGAAPVGAEGCWGVSEACPEGAAVEPVGAGVNPPLAAIEGDDKGHEMGLKKSRQYLIIIINEQKTL